LRTGRQALAGINLRPSPPVRSLLPRMGDQMQKAEQPLEIDKLPPGSTVMEVFIGVGIALGLSLLWALEVVRNGYFHVLDRMNVSPRQRRVSAFPPGRPRKRTTVEARR